MAQMLVLGACTAKPVEPERPDAPVVVKPGSAHLFESASQALLEGEPERALELLHQHETKYAKDWAGERDGMKLVAMCASGREAEAMEIVAERARAERRAIEAAERTGSGVMPFSSAPYFVDDMPARTHTEDCTARLEASFEEIVYRPARCRGYAEQARFEECLGEVAPGPSWEAVKGAPVPQGYVCSFFGGPQRRCEEIRGLQRWRERAPETCQRFFTLYRAMHPGWGPDRKMLDLGEGRPPDAPRIHAFDSDGIHVAFTRLSDYVLEARACMEAASTDAALMGWATRIQPEVFGAPSSSHPGP